jgi:ABC-type branched-subunit amino acid transport system substrate-binding protein
VFGEGLLSAAKAVFQEKGIEHVGNSYHSLNDKEFSGYLTNAAAAKPDVLLLLNFGAQSSAALRQAVSFGMHKNMTILMAWASGLDQFAELGAELCEGVYFGAQYWHTADTPTQQEPGEAHAKQAQDPAQLQPRGLVHLHQDPDRRHRQGRQRRPEGRHRSARRHEVRRPHRASKKSARPITR